MGYRWQMMSLGEAAVADGLVLGAGGRAYALKFKDVERNDVSFALMVTGGAGLYIGSGNYSGRVCGLAPWACDSNWINLNVTNPFDWDDLDGASVSGTDAQVAAGYGPASVAAGKVVISAKKQVLTPPSGSASLELFKAELSRESLSAARRLGQQVRKAKFGMSAYGMVLVGVIVLIGH
jgi:hypothetical protein